jgi:HD superfamily phosphohydrolase
LSNKTNVRDPIHNYIYMTDVEESVVQHPLFQRLRFISQNGAAYYTYPSNRHDRFLHSLGVMQLGGDIFLNATEDLLDKDVATFLTKAFHFIKETASTLGITLKSVTEDYFNQKNHTFVKYNLSLNEDISAFIHDLNNESSSSALKITRVVLFQSLRLACLLHDVGHFPYSHTIEYAFTEYIQRLQEVQENQGKLNDQEKTFLENYQKLKQHLRVGIINKAIHELIGIKMLDEILPADNLKAFQRLCRSIARLILTKQDQEPILLTLYDIVSGELDADRLDYSLRDPYSSGLEFGQVDMERLLNNFTLVNDKDEYRILPRVQALSSIETFYHNRYLSYKYLIYHHSKVRMDQIVGEITIRLISIYFNSRQQVEWVNTILRKNRFDFLWSKLNGIIPIGNNGDNNYFYCDEGWFNSLIKEIYFTKGEFDLQDKELEALLLLIETFIFRKTGNIISLFKRYDTYLNFFDIIFKKFEQEEGLLLNREEFNRDCITLIIDGGLEEFISQVKREHDIILMVKTTTPKSIAYDKDGNAKLKVVVNKNKEIIPIQRLSPYLESLKFMNDSDQLFHIFLVGQDIKDRGIGNQIEVRLHTFIKNKILEERS